MRVPQRLSMALGNPRPVPVSASQRCLVLMVVLPREGFEPLATHIVHLQNITGLEANGLFATHRGIETLFTQSWKGGN